MYRAPIPQRVDATQGSFAVTDWRSFDLSFCIDVRDRTISSANGAAMTVLGLDTTPAPADAVLAASTTTELLSLLPALRKDQTWRGTLELRPTAFGRREIESVLTVDSGAPERISIIATEITQPEEYLAELAHRATHDFLTGLPNRALLMDRLTLATARFERSRRPLAVMLIDLDDFKQINDNLGHATGDTVLVQSGAAMSSALRPADTLARLGGDEFVALCTDLETAEDAIPIAERVVAHLRMVTNPHSGQPMTASIGIAITNHRFPADSHTLLEVADRAMYDSKLNKPARISLRESGVDSPVWRIEAGDPQALMDAIDSDTLSVTVQPVVDLRSGLVIQLRARPAFEGLDGFRYDASGLLVDNPDEELRATVDAWTLNQAHRLSSELAAHCGRVPRVTVQLGGTSLTANNASAADVMRQVMGGPTWGALGVEIDQADLNPDLSRKSAELDDAGVAVLIRNFNPSFRVLRALDHSSARTGVINLADLGNIHDRNTQRLVSAARTSAAAMGLSISIAGIGSAEELNQAMCLELDAAEGPLFGLGMSLEQAVPAINTGWSIDYW